MINFMWKYYKFEIDQKKLIQIRIESSFSNDVYFQVYEDNDKYIAYWRKALLKNEYFDKIIGKTYDIILKSITLDELLNTTEYREILDKYCPVCSAVLNKKQQQIIKTFLQTDIDKNVKKPYGRDGHSYYIEVYYSEYKKYHCWCRLPEKWNTLADVINLLVTDIADLDYKRYGCNITKFL